MKAVSVSNDMKPELMALWNRCFEHDEDFCGFFFEHQFAPERALAAVDEEGKICSALHFFEGQYQDESGRVNDAWYLYGVATAPGFRRKGYGSFLIRELGKAARIGGICAMYLTAEETAWNFYEEIGFVRNAFLSRTVFEPCRAGNLSWTLCGMEDFRRLRLMYTGGLKNAFTWNGASLDFMYSDLIRDGQVLRCVLDGNEYYAAVRLREGELTVVETSFPRDSGDLLAGSIAEKFGGYSTVSVFGTADERFLGSTAANRETFYKGHTLFLNGTPPAETVYMNLLAD